MSISETRAALNVQIDEMCTLITSTERIQADVMATYRASLATLTAQRDALPVGAVEELAAEIRRGYDASDYAATAVAHHLHAAGYRKIVLTASERSLLLYARRLQVAGGARETTHDAMLAIIDRLLGGGA